MVSGAHSREALGRGGRTKEAGNLSQAEDGLIKTMPGRGVRLSATKEASEGLLGQRCPTADSFPITRQPGLNGGGKERLSPFHKPVPGTGAAHRKAQVRLIE